VENNNVFVNHQLNKGTFRTVVNESVMRTLIVSFELINTALSATLLDI
jgi:hypothetical protein